MSSSPAMTWALVTDEAGRRRPSPSPRSRARRRCRAREDRGPPRLHVRVVGDRRVGGRDRGRRPEDRGRRVDPVERVEDRARGRHQLVEAAQDQRALHVWRADCRCPARAGRRRRRPRPARAPRGDERRAAGAVGQVQATALADSRSRRPRAMLSRVTATRRRQTAPRARPNSGAYGDSGPSREQQRRRAGCRRTAPPRTRPGSARRRSTPGGSPRSRAPA